MNKHIDVFIETLSSYLPSSFLPFITIIFVYSVSKAIDQSFKKDSSLTKNEIELLRKLLSYSINKDEIDSLRNLLLSTRSVEGYGLAVSTRSVEGHDFAVSTRSVEGYDFAVSNTFKKIHDIDLIIKQIPKLFDTVNELLIDVKKLEESIENVQDAIHSHTAPDIKKTIFNDYKSVLKNHNDRLLFLQTKVEKYAEHRKDEWLMLPQAEIPISERATPSPCIEIETLSKVKSDILIKSDIFNDDNDSVDKN